LSVGVTAEVKSKLSVVDVVGESVTLKKAGTTYKGLCPFHGEKTPSFVVTPARESWHCFGCGLGGDIFSFVMQRDNATFPEALRTLAARAGVSPQTARLRDARTCYSHLAGRLGVALADALVAARWLEEDRTERRPHIAGPVGTALATLALERGWIRRVRGTRAVVVTPAGRTELQQIFHV